MAGDAITVLVGGTEILRLPCESLGLDKRLAPIGIRWLGATVRPIN